MDNIASNYWQEESISRQQATGSKQKSEVRGQRSEVGRQMTPGKKSEIGGRRSEVRRQHAARS